MRIRAIRTLCIVLMLGLFMMFFVSQCGKKQPESVTMKQAFIKTVINDMVAKFGKEHARRIETGVKQVEKLWCDADGNDEAFRDFCTNNFIVDKNDLDKAFERLEVSFETLFGTLLEQERQFQWNLQVDTGPILPVDYLLANFSLNSHVEEDLYKTKIAFFVLLNFEIKSLEDALKQGDKWSRQKWAEVRLAQQFTSRVPSDVSQQKYETYVTADNYISNYNIYMHNLLNENDERLFPEGLKLITHWGLRDELKAQYAEADGFPRQKMIYDVMQKIIFQEIPQVVIDNPDVDWKVSTNEVSGKSSDNSREGDTRYQMLLSVFHAEKATDPYYPLYPSKIDRRFQRDREIPEKTVEKLFEDLLTSKEFKRTGQLIQKRLGRDLESFDIWYKGFKPASQYSESKLDKIVAAKYPSVEDFERDIPNILMKLGFDQETAEFLSLKIEVDPSRGAGHAMGAGRRSDNAHLRTRVPKDGMNYKGFNIAIHELGHNVEQVFSLNKIDHTLLEGVPNTAFTEAFAFLFQKRDLEILGLHTDDPNAEHLDALNQIWSTGEIAGVSLVDMKVWRWMYDNPEATAAELREAVIQIAREVWSRYFYPVLGHKDAPILAIYSHMIDGGLYLPDYPIGHIIQLQIEEFIKDKNLAVEMERMCVQGSITPNLWIQQAVGENISIKPTIKAAEKALKALS
ncbi:hypothetical protein KJ656_13800 [bacterium]|nr:hypothetical protein [bacterium]